MWAWFILFFFVVLSFFIKENTTLVEVKRRYKVLRESSLPEKFSILKKEILITGYKSKVFGVGFNTHKGSEIGLCLDGSANCVFHVLLHELAHSTVKEYDHSPLFWSHLEELKNHSTNLGIYERIPHEIDFCGNKIRD